MAPGSGFHDLGEHYGHIMLTHIMCKNLLFYDYTSVRKIDFIIMVTRKSYTNFKFHVSQCRDLHLGRGENTEYSL